MSAAFDRAERIAALGYDFTEGAVEPVRNCNLCRGDHFVEVARRDRYGYPTVLLVCSRCGLGFLSPRPTHAAYGAFYRDVYRPLVSAYHGRRIDAETLQKEQGEYAEALADFVRRSTGVRPRNVLDIGGSTGIVARAFAGAGTTLTVLDPAPEELAVAAVAGMETFEGFAEDFEPGDRRWDLVLLCQTIDHLLDVKRTLRALRGLLAGGGHAFVDILDVGWTLIRTGTIEGSYKVDHPFYLRRATARSYFELTGFTVVAERMADDGHWGFLLTPGAERKPDWEALAVDTREFLAEVWRRRAQSQ